MENIHKKELTIIPNERIINKIFLIRNKKIMLDRDLAELYQVETKVLNQAVKRNLERFPEDFMFQLTKEEFENLKFQIETSSSRYQIGTSGLRSQIVTLKNGRGQHIKYLPYAFTEQGVAMLSSVLNSKRAIQVNIQIIRTFTQFRELLMTNKALSKKIENLEKKFEKHDDKIKQVFDVLKQLFMEKAKPKKQIGFRVK